MSDQRAAFEAVNPHLDYTHSADAWGRDTYKHSHIQIAWEYWQAALSQRAPISDAPVQDAAITEYYRDRRSPTPRKTAPQQVAEPSVLAGTDRTTSGAIGQP